MTNNPHNQQSESPAKPRKLTITLPLSGQAIKLLNGKDFDEITINPPSDYLELKADRDKEQS